MASPKSSGRMIRKSVSESKGIGNLSAEAAVLFFMLIPHYNPHGKMMGGPGFIKDEVVPYREDLSYENLPQYLQEISDKTNVKWFRINGKWWLHSLNFLSEHQDLRADKLGEDKLPDWTVPADISGQSESSTGVVPDFPSRAEGLKVEDLREEENQERKESSSPEKVLTTPPTPNAEQKAETRTECFSIFEFRNAYQQASGELLPGGLNNAAQQLCMRHPRDKLEAAFEVMAKHGGRTFRYLEGVLSGKPKASRGSNGVDVVETIAVNQAVVREFSGVDPERLRFALVFHWLAEKYPLKGVPRVLSLPFLVDYYEALADCDLDDVEAGARFHFNHGSKFFPQAPPALRESIQVVVSKKTRLSFQASLETDQLEPDDPAELLRYYLDTIEGMERLGLDTTGWFVDESGDRPRLVTGA